MNDSSCSGASWSFMYAYDLVEPSWSLKVTHGEMTSSIDVPRDAEREEGPVREGRPGRDRRHPAMERVEGVGAAHEVGGALRRAADARELRHALGGKARVEHRLEDPLGDRVVAAAGAQGGLRSPVLDHGQAEPVHLRAGAGRRSALGHGYLPSMPRISSVTERASSGRPLTWAMLRRGGASSGAG